MCERYALPEQATAEREFTPARTWWKFAPKFNVAPRRFVPAIRIHEGQSEGLMMHWGLIPAGPEGRLAPPAPRIDLDQLDRAASTRMPWLSSQRCIVPVSGFYVWRLTDARFRQPYFVRLTNRSLFGLAGVWDRSAEDDDVIESFAVIMVAANELIAEVSPANPKMPAVLKRRDYHTWLKGTPVEAKAVLAPYASHWMQAHAVSPRINSLQPDDAGLITPISRLS